MARLGDFLPTLPGRQVNFSPGWIPGPGATVSRTNISKLRPARSGSSIPPSISL